MGKGEWRHDKRLFWGLVAATLALCAVPSALLLEAFQRYYRLAVGYDPGAFRAMRTRLVPHREAAPREEALEFVEFRIAAPKAKAVSLMGDFNGWSAPGLPLARTGSRWEVAVPLPAGSYRYVFVVDGAETLDPAKPSFVMAGPRKASLIQVR